MVYALGLLSHLLFASLALARPGSGFGGGLAKRLERRRGHPNIPVNSGLVRHHNSSEYQEILSSNWAGGVIESAPYSAPATSGIWNIVEGTFTVPAIGIPGGGGAGNPNTLYGASVWVGIDGDTCEGAILQTGIDLKINSHGVISYDAWYEWWPDYAYDYPGAGVIGQGDTMMVSIMASTATSGQAIIHNLSKRWSVSHTFTAQPTPLCQQNAEWIVEDYSYGDSQIPFVNFGEVTWTNARAVANAFGPSAGVINSSPAAAQVWDIQQEDGAILTSTSVWSGGLQTLYV